MSLNSSEKKELRAAGDAAAAKLRLENELLARLDSYEALKKEFVTLHRKYNELLEGVSQHAVFFGTLLQRSDDFDSFKQNVRDKQGEDFLRHEAKQEALARLCKAPE